MNLILVKQWSGELNRISKADVAIGNLQVGDRLRVGIPEGPWGEVTIAKIDGTHYWTTGTLDRSPPPPLPVSVGIGFVRPKMMRRILSSTIEMGVKDIHLFKSYLCEKSYFQSEMYEASQLDDIIKKALQQACDTIAPKITIHTSLKPFLEDHLLKRFRSDQIVISDPDGVPCEKYSLGGTVAILFGPERGFSNRELAMFQQMQMPILRFGSRHLRCETAVPFILGRLALFL